MRTVLATYCIAGRAPSQILHLAGMAMLVDDRSHSKAGLLRAQEHTAPVCKALVRMVHLVHELAKSFSIQVSHENHGGLLELAVGLLHSITLVLGGACYGFDEDACKACKGAVSTTEAEKY